MRSSPSLRHRRCRLQGFTLVETLIALAIFATVSAIAIPNLFQALERARYAKVVSDIRAIANDITAYNATYDKYPDTLDDIGRGDLHDPWGHSYQYLNFDNAEGRGKMRKDRFLVPINTNFDLYSMGPDGKSVSPLTAAASQDDIIYANDGEFVGVAAEY